MSQYFLKLSYRKERLGADYEGKITTYTGGSQRYLQLGMCNEIDVAE
jgi:hypothetical protein